MNWKAACVSVEKSREEMVFTCRGAGTGGCRPGDGSGVKVPGPPTARQRRVGSAEAIPPALYVNTESLAAIKAIPARYLTAFKVAQRVPPVERRATPRALSPSRRRFSFSSFSHRFPRHNEASAWPLRSLLRESGRGRAECGAGGRPNEWHRDSSEN